MPIGKKLPMKLSDKWDIFAKRPLLPNKKAAVRKELERILGEQLAYWMEEGSRHFALRQSTLPSFGGHQSGEKQPTTVRPSDADVNGGLLPTAPLGGTDPIRLPADPLQGIAKGAIRMNLPSRFEIGTLANEIFEADHERRIRDFAQEETRVLAQVRSTHNIGGYAPALVQCGVERLRSEILTLADAWAEAFTLYGVPSDVWAEKALEKAALQMAGGTVSGIRGQLHLLKIRTRNPIQDVRGHLEREISASMNGALREGKLRLKRQRIKSKDSESPTVNRARGAETAVSSRALSGKSSLGVTEGAMADAAKGIWHKYQVWFEANLEPLEAMAARSDPLHLPLDEQDAQRFSTTAAKQRFDEMAEDDYRRWVDSGLPHETFSARLSELHAQVLKASLELWSVGSETLRQWYEKNCQPRADSALTGRMARWEHRARTDEIVRRVSRDRGLVVTGLIEKLDKLTTEEAQQVPALEERLRLRVWIHPTSHRFEGGHSGEFLERARLTIAEVGMQLGPASGIPPIDFCLCVLLRELVCERESLNHPQIARLNSEQLGRYLWAPYIGNSITPESGEILNLCEALKWYCQRLIGLLDSPDAVLRINGGTTRTPIEDLDRLGDAARRRGRRPNQERRDAIHQAISRNGDKWRDHLPDIFGELDNKDVFLGNFQRLEIDVGEGKITKVQSWDDLGLAEGKQLKRIIDALRKYAD
jgi:hypothetical protein